MAGLRYESFADMPPKMREKMAPVMLKNASRCISVADGGNVSKYRNTQSTVRGIKFQSIKEAQRYLELLSAEKAGAITELKLQHEFTLCPAYTASNGIRIRAIRYNADFTYKVLAPDLHRQEISASDYEYWTDQLKQRGLLCLVVEDVKSKATKTKVYSMKRKMMAEQGYFIREV